LEKIKEILEMRTPILPLLALVLLTGCGIQPNQLVAPVRSEAVESQAVTYKELAVTDPVARALVPAIQAYQESHEWQTRLKEVHAVAAHPTSNGRVKYYVNGIFDGGFNFESDVTATVDPTGKVVALADAPNKPKIGKLPFKAANAQVLKSIEGKLAPYLREEWQVALIEMTNGQSLAVAGGNVYRMDVILQPATFPAAIKQRLEVRLDARGDIADVAGL
jgi:hypothetical protein